ncbi:MAG: hypothetical protein ACOYB1_16555 [Limnohabitans sp.]
MNMLSRISAVQAMPHWADRYLGEPWVTGTHDCWHFARRVWRERFGWQVSALEVDALDRLASLRAFAGHQEYRHWTRVETTRESAREGDACLMGRSARPCHIGVVVDLGVTAGNDPVGILHCLQGAGVVFTPYGRLGSLGLQVVSHYRRCPHAQVLAQGPAQGPARGAA